MRKSLEAVALAALAFQAWITYRAFFGPDPLPAKIPTHFDAAGNPNAWGSPATLLFLPAIAVFIYLLFTVVTRFPSAFNYSVGNHPGRAASHDHHACQLDAIHVDRSVCHDRMAHSFDVQGRPGLLRRLKAGRRTTIGAWCGGSEVRRISRAPEPQVLRLRLAQNTRQSTLRMTVNFDANFRLGTLESGSRNQKTQRLKSSSTIAAMVTPW